MASTAASQPSRWYAGIWLVYVGFVFVEPYVSRQPIWMWALAVLSIAVFVPLYFQAFANAWKRPRRAIAMTLATAAIGLAMVPINVGGSTYVIFSAAVAGFVFHRRRDAILYVLALGAVLMLEMWLIRQPFESWMLWQPALVVMVGLGNILAAEEGRRNQAVRRAQEDVEEMAKLAERERIARDLHDVLGHTLSVIALKSELAARLAEVDPARAVREIREVEQVSRAALSEVRAAVEGYRGRGLRGELQSAAQALRAAGVTLDTDVAPLPLPPKQETVLALAVREAITNVVRHAGATRCRISLREQAGRIVLRIEDDGVGGQPREGNGLGGMRERITAIGGTLVVDAGRPVTGGPAGFVLTVTVQ